jgi:tetratricopeptide (TPR) repeat protein
MGGKQRQETAAPRPLRHRTLLLAVGVLLAAGVAVVWWCERRPEVSYLPDGGPGHWILYPAVPDMRAEPAGERTTVFSRSFELTRPPAHAPLRLCAFGGFSVALNGTTLADAAPDRLRDWKKPAEVDAGPWLRPGENRLTVSVSNDQGPPALWLTCDCGEQVVISDGQWECSLLGAIPQPARLATAVPLVQAGSPAADGESVAGALAACWQALLLLAALAAAGVAVVHLADHHGWFRARRFPGPVVAVAVVVLAWLVLFVNNWQSLSFPVGFDARQHLEYIRHVQHRGALPLADEGWEMHQPPLYYVLAALVLKAGGLEADAPAGLLVLRLLGLLTGLALVFLMAACVRLLAPAAPLWQGVGLLVAACLPMHLYLTHYPANDLLAAVLATAAVYLCLKILQAEQPSTVRLSALGVCLGAALLTKLTTAGAVVVILAVLAGRLAVRRRPARAWLHVLGVPLLVCVALCGWWFVRNYLHFGTPLIGSYDPSSGFRWWQDPGYGTSSQLARFGRSLTSPYYSVVAGVPDGLFSTLWGDGDWGSLLTRGTRPPWNYDLMAAGYLLALVPGGLALVGGVAALVELVRRPRAEWFLLAGLPAALSLTLLYHYLKYPYACHVKAFYALPAALTLCALAGWGFETLTRRWRAGRLVLGVALGAWALTAYASFFVDGGAPATQTWVAQQHLAGGQPRQALALLGEVLRADPDNTQAHLLGGQMLLAAGAPREAADHFEHALHAAPGAAEAHQAMAVALAALGRNAQAAEHLETAISLAPDSLPPYPLLAALRGHEGDAAGVVSAARRGLRVSPTDPGLHAALAAALAAGGNTAESIEHYRIALRFQPDTLPALLGLARLLATCEEEGVRDGREAVRLAGRACALTHGEDAVALETLAAAQAESGDFREAERGLQRALEAAGKSRQTRLGERLREQLPLYQSGRPLREKPRLGPGSPDGEGVPPSKGAP